MEKYITKQDWKEYKEVEYARFNFNIGVEILMGLFIFLLLATALNYRNVVLAVFEIGILIFSCSLILITWNKSNQR